jgi:hypothetical protein
MTVYEVLPVLCPIRTSDDPESASMSASLIGRLTTATSSFCNLALVQLLARRKLVDLKERLRVVNSTRQINEMVRSRLEREGKSAAA